MTAIERVVAYVESLEGFRIVADLGAPYTHMGALLADAVLQAGINYKTVVEPRVKRLERSHPDAQTTSGLLALLREYGPETLLTWKRGRKPETLLDLGAMLQEKGVETVEDLRAWLSSAGNDAELLSVRGVGPKTVDYLRILSGLPAIAVDSRLRGFLADAGCPTSDYDEARRLLEGVADAMGVHRALLDHSIWEYVADRKAANRSVEPTRKRTRAAHA